MNVAGFAILVMCAISIGLDIAKNGKTKKVKHDIRIDLLASAIWIALLYYAGAFNGIFV